MLRQIFGWFDAHPEAYWIIATVPTTALLTLVITRIWQRDTSAKPRIDGLFGGLVVAVLFAWRWPILLAARDLNQDEGQLIAGAMTLLHDPVFWRSVDGTTSGPLNYYVLLPFHFLGLPLDYFTARLVGLVLVSIALLACYRLLRSLTSETAARLAVLPALGFFAIATHDDFTHYSSEHVSLALVALAAFGIMRRPPSGVFDQRALLLGVFIAGLLPWAKLQSAPLAAVLGAYALWITFADVNRGVRARWLTAAAIVGAALLPTLLGLLAVALSGQFEHFWRNYVVQNFVYVQDGVSLRRLVRKLLETAGGSIDIPVFFGVSAAILFICAVFYVRRRLRPGALLITGALLTFVAAACVLAPRRPFAHYLLLLIIPLTLWSGAAIAELWSHLVRPRRTALLWLVIGGIIPFAARFGQPVPPPVGQLIENWRRPYSVAGTLLRAYSKSGEPLGVWGWRTDLFVESSTIQATRDPHSYWSIRESPWRDYYRARYVSDLQASRPRYFVDAIGKGAMAFQDRRTQGHESVPALRDFIQRDYVLIADLGLERIYARKGATPSDAKLPAYRIQNFINHARKPPDEDAKPPQRVDPPTMSGWNFNGQGVRSLQPPASVTWVLSGNEREVVLEYGFHPRAYQEGHSNGADLIVELETDGLAPRCIFRRRIDPARALSDRGPLKTRVPLPPFQPKSRLVVRTEAGEFNDAAWDWVYLSPPKFMRQSGYTESQFPGFSRVPDFADANRSTPFNDGRVTVLLLNAPSILTFILDGTERSLRFSYGVELPVGAKIQRSHDAVFCLELHREGEPIRELFRNELRPLESNSDRLRQFARLVLSETRPDDQLVLRIESLGSEAVIGSYVTDFFLE